MRRRRILLAAAALLIAYALGGPVLADALVPLIDHADSAAACTAIEHPSSGGCNCQPDATAVNARYAPLYQVLRAPADIATVLTASPTGLRCHCVPQAPTATLANGTCTLTYTPPQELRDRRNRTTN